MTMGAKPPVGNNRLLAYKHNTYVKQMLQLYSGNRQDESLTTTYKTCSIWLSSRHPVTLIKHIFLTSMIDFIKQSLKLCSH